MVFSRMSDSDHSYLVLEAKAFVFLVRLDEAAAAVAAEKSLSRDVALGRVILTDLENLSPCSIGRSMVDLLDRMLLPAAEAAPSSQVWEE